MKIDLHPPCIIEIISVSQDCLVTKIDMRDAGGEFVVLSPVTGLDIRLGIDVTMR